MKKIIALVLMIILVPAIIITSCKKDKEEPTPTNSTTYSITLTGTVVDVNMSPLQGVNVEVAGKSAITGYDGTFYFTNLNVPQERFEVSFSKTGYFTLSRSAIPESGAKFDFEVGLISETDFTYAGSTGFTNAAGGTLSMTNGCQIVFPTNAFVTSTGAAYTGNVNVNACFLDPTMSNYAMFTFGGDMHGKDSTGSVVMLNPFSGLNVVVKDDSGNLLQLDEANNVKASVTMQIPTGLALVAPSSIDLMEYDETEGMCMASGSATKSGDKYLGQVGHFSFWSCQKIHPGKAYISGRVTDGTNGVPGVRVHIGRIAGNSDLIVITDIDGNYSATVPSGLSGFIGIYPSYYGQFITPVNIPLLADDQNFVAPDIVVPPLKTVTGRLVNCSGLPVAGGRVVLSWYSNTSFTMVHAACFSKPDGTFSLQMETSVMYADLHTWGNNTTVQTYSNYISTDPFNLGDITLCPPIQTGPNQLTVQGGPYTTATTINTFDTKDGYKFTGGATPHTFVYLYGSMGEVSMAINGVTTGNYAVGSKSVTSILVYFYSPVYFMDSVQTGSVTVTKYNAVGNLIEGTFSGTTYSGVQITNGKFSVVRSADQ